jgi:hypothetical protein
MQYLIIGRDHPNGFETRQKHRTAHLEGAKKLKEEGKLLYAVAMIENGKMVGSVMIMDFASLDELEEWKGTEPYITGGVWKDIEITECAIPPLFT